MAYLSYLLYLLVDWEEVLSEANCELWKQRGWLVLESPKELGILYTFLPEKCEKHQPHLIETLHNTYSELLVGELEDILRLLKNWLFHPRSPAMMPQKSRFWSFLVVFDHFFQRTLTLLHQLTPIGKYFIKNCSLCSLCNERNPSKF